jgi:hypothetical protein
MTNYIVHIYREMRLTFDGIAADSIEAAASIACGKPTGDADDIDDCEGESFSALVDVAGDAEYEQSRFIDFEPQLQRNAAARILASLKSIIPYAENEAYSLERHKDSPEAEAEAEKAWKAVTASREAIAAAEAAGISPTPAIEVHSLLADRHQIAHIWSIPDVQSVRPDLTDDEAWEVLQSVHHDLDANCGITWLTLLMTAQHLFGDVPASIQA